MIKALIYHSIFMHFRKVIKMKPLTETSNLYIHLYSLQRYLMHFWYLDQHFVILRYYFSRNVNTKTNKIITSNIYKGSTERHFRSM